MSDVQDEYAEYAAPIIEEAKADYDLGKRLRTRPMRQETVRVYTDEVAGARLGGMEPVFDNMGRFAGNRGWGIVKDLQEILDAVKQDSATLKELRADAGAEHLTAQIAELEATIAEQQERAEELQAEAKTIAATLAESAMEFELKSLPPIVRDSAKRKAREELKMKGKMSEEQKEEYDREHAAQLLALATVTFRDIAEGHKQDGITVKEARLHRDFLPESEFGKLTEKLRELEFQASIAKSAVDDPDFSQAGS